MNDFEKSNARRWWLIALVSGLIGAAIASAIICGVLYSKGLLGSDETTTTVSGQRVIVNSTDVNSQIEAVAQVVPASVVGIQCNVKTTSFGFWGMPTENEGSSVGSGFIVTSDGYIATNQHVISGANTIEVSLENKSTYEADVIWSDESLDLAVLKIKAKNLPTVVLGNSDEIKVGQTAIAIGNPKGLNYSRSVTAGIISALDRSLVVDSSTVAENLIQTDATINAGNSGGVLCNGDGEVIGINTYKNYDAEGMGFAIPVNILKPILNSIIESGSFDALKIGISGIDTTQASYYNNAPEFDRGLYVVSVEEGKGAANAGIKEGDIIIMVDDTEINSMLELKTYLYGLKAGDTVQVTYLRQNTEKTTEVKLYK